MTRLVTSKIQEINNASKRVCVGCITAPHGLRGQMTVKPFTQDPLDFLSYGPLITEKGEMLPPLRILHITKKTLVAVTMDGVLTAEQAERYRGVSLYVLRENLPLLKSDADDDTYYHTDLIGLNVQDLQGQLWGRVKEIHDFGAGVLLEVVPQGEEEGIFIPFRKEMVPLVDIKEGFIQVDPTILDAFSS